MIDRDALGARYADHLRHLTQEYEQIAADGGWGAIVLMSGRALPTNPFDDQHHPLSPTPAFGHWVPLRSPDAALVFVPGAPPRLVHTVIDDFWEAPTPLESDHFWTHLDVIEIADPARLFDQVPAGRVGVITRDPADVPRGEVNPPEL